MKIPLLTDFLNYRRDIKELDAYVDSARELMEGPNAITNSLESMLSIVVDESSQLEKFEKLTIADYLDKPIPDLVTTLVKTNASVSQMQTVYSVLIAQDPRITADTDAGQRIIDAELAQMEDMNSPWSLSVQHMASSIITRGNVLLETEFDEFRSFQGIHVVDPKWYHAKLIDTQGSQRWVIGRYINSEFTPIDSPNIRFQGINTLVGERMARSPLQTAVWPALAEADMLSTLQSLMNVTLFSQKIIKILERKIMEVLPNAPQNVRDKFVNSAHEKIKAAGNVEPNKPIVLTDNIEVGTSTNGSSGITWVDMMSRLFDRKIYSGGNQPPIVGGSNEFVAESSSRSQLSFYSTYLVSGQQIIKDCAEWAWTRVLRSQGNASNVVYSSKSIDSFTRVEEAKAFGEVVKSIQTATAAGLSIEAAITWYEYNTDTTLPDNVKSLIISSQSEPTD